MDIIKRLQLNKNPKDIKSGSVIGAKNIMLDPISSSITNEYGFKTAYEAPSGFKIVGAIPCNEEIVIFLYNSNSKQSKIYRLSETNNLPSREVESNWKWEGGTVFGTFAYNYKNQLIIALSEKDANKDVPLKIINLDICKATDKITYNLEEEIPKFNINYTVEQKGSLVCGTYTFFIRFLISKDTYTKWFQITDDIIIIDSVIKEKPKHTYDNGNLNITGIKNILINTNLISNRSINLNLNIDTDKFETYQIGYIIKHDSDTKGRILNNYNIAVKNITISNNNFLEELDITELLEEPNQFYNVKNLINYNNRLYISNYSFNKNDYDRNQEIANNIKVYLKTIDIPVNLDDEYKYQIYGYSGRSSTGELEYVCDLDNKFLDNTYLSLEDSIEFLKKIKLYNLSRNSIIQAIDTLNNYSFINSQKPIASRYPEDNYNLDTSENIPGSASFWIIPNNNPVNNLSKCIRIANATNIRYNTNTHFNELVNLSFNEEIRVKGDENNHIIIKYQNLEIDLTKAYFGVLFYTTNGHVQFSDYIGQEGVIGLTFDFPAHYHTTYILKYEQQQRLVDYSNVGLHYNNNRTLIPGQIYNFYVHFVRKDMSVTEGYRIIPGSNEPIFNKNTKNVYIDSSNESSYFYKILIQGAYYFYCPGVFTKDNNNKLIVPNFKLDKNKLINTDFIGFFITYEDINIVSIPVVGTEEKLENNINYKHFTNTEYLYNVRNLTGNYILETFRKYGNISNVNKQYNITSKSVYAEFYKEQHLRVVSNISDFQKGTSEDIPTKYAFCIYDENIYQNTYKTLYQLTNIVFVDENKAILENNYDNSYCYLPGFLNYEKVFIYDKEVVLSPVTNNNYDKQGNTIGDYEITQFLFNNYCNTPINAISLKQDYDKGSLVIMRNNAYYKTVFNSVLEPNKLNDFLELKASYNSKPIKSYTNHNEDSQNSFEKTIYRSDIISDESLNNGFRHFNIENYKNIIENKGNIVNIVGYGLYMLVHTEYSLFVFDRNNQLSENAQLQIPDVFDIDYKELTPSGEGFGGLKNKEESILTKHGYIWFDRISLSIFLFDGQIKPISADIHNLLKKIFSTYYFPEIRFGEDYISNRLLVCINYQSGNRLYTITLSYSFDTNTFISSHDYSFDKNYKTYNRSYFFKKGEETENKLYIFNRSSSDYLELRSLNSGLNTIIENNKVCSYVDIIFNDLYEIPKTLNSISYIMSRNNDFNLNTNIIDKYFNTDFDNEKHQNKLRLYSGFKLYICTDLTFSGELDISKSEEINILNGNKPYWNNGVWNFNWFRENINKDVTNDELQQQNVNNQMKEVYQQHDNLYQSGLEKSDMRSTINGKYFILRFVFERNNEDLNLKFETLDVNISKL